MWQPKTTLLVLVLAAASLRASCTSTAAGPSGKPLVTAVRFDPSTNLFTSPLNSGRPLALDLSSEALSVPCNTQTMKVAVSAFETDGKKLLEPQVSVPATASCAAAPPGVAGLGPSPLSFSSQAASLERLPNKFALCLPGEPPFDNGAAIFGGGPLFSPSLITQDQTLRPPEQRQDVAKLLSPEIPLRRLPQTGLTKGPAMHYVSARYGGGIAMGGKLLVEAGAGQGRFPVNVGLSTTAPYTELREDVYGRVRDAFERALGPDLGGAKVTPPTAPFELCYDPNGLPEAHNSLRVDFMLEGGQNWTASAVKTLSRWTECFAFVRAKRQPSAGMPAVVLGGYHVGDRVVVFDQDKQKISFTPPLSPQIACGNTKFNR